MPRPTASPSCRGSRKPESCHQEQTKPRSQGSCDPPGNTFGILTPRPTASPSCRSSLKPESCRPDRTQWTTPCQCDPPTRTKHLQLSRQ
eukprot:1408273-Rhodomonas_salina.1